MSTFQSTEAEDDLTQLQNATLTVKITIPIGGAQI
jgi:hypothetical protein